MAHAPRPFAPRSLARILEADPQLAQWQRRVDRDEAILRVLRRVLPTALVQGISVRDAEPGELVLAARSGAAASALRQRGPDLLSLLAREGWEFTAIVVVVQPRNWVSPAKKAVPHQWDSRANAPLSALRDRLPDGPLKEALAALLGRHRG